MSDLLQSVATPSLRAAPAGRTDDGGPSIGDRQGSNREARLRRVARDFEAAFLAEMLRDAGVARMPKGLNGGAGEAAFSGSLVAEYAKVIAAAGGIGLADTIYRSLAGRSAR